MAGASEGTSAATIIPPAVASVLQSLSSRPNVQSTLILARRDGSVLSATGALASPRHGGIILPYQQQQQQQRSSSTRDETPLAAEPPIRTEQRVDGGSAGGTGHDDKEEAEKNSDAGPPPPPATAAEQLAATIMAFVAAAVDVGAALGASHTEGGDDTKRAKKSYRPLDAAAADGAKQPRAGGGGAGGPARDPAEEDGDESDGEGDGEADVQLLRLRSRRREIIIYPDASFLCCVVQSVAKHKQAASSAPLAAATANGR